MVFSTVWNRTGHSTTTNPKVAKLHMNTQYCPSQTACKDHPHPISSFLLYALHRVVHREDKAAKYVEP